MRDFSRFEKQWFIKCKEIHNDKYDYSKSIYTGSKLKLIITCPIHGDFEQIADNHSHGKGCPKCANRLKSKWRQRDQTEFIESCKLVHHNFYDYSDTIYISVNNKINITCPEHGDFIQRASAHEGGQGCPICNNWKSELNLFNKLKNEFKDLNIISQYSPGWLGRQRFDIGIPQLNIAIEYNGKQHYEYIPYFHKGGKIDFEKQINRDNEKENKCKMNGYLLIKLKYNYTELELQKLIELINNKLNDRRK